MLGTQTLTPEQQLRVESVAREIGVACLRCGSTDLRSENRAILAHNHVEVMLLCSNPNADHPENVAALYRSHPFDYEDAARFGIEKPPDSPLRRRPGGMFPR